MVKLGKRPEAPLRFAFFRFLYHAVSPRFEALSGFWHSARRQKHKSYFGERTHFYWGELEMNILMGMLLTLLLLSSPFLSCVLAAPPAIQRQMEIVNATIDGGGPVTIDPAACYDTASGELIMNIYETLVFFDGEHMDRYLPQLADSWTVENITGTTSPDGLPWYFRYTFHIRPNVHFWNGDALTPEDVEYCFERGMVLEAGYNPQWMFYEPLLNTWGALGLNVTTLDGNGTEQARVGAIIDHSVESNGTHLWFNLAYPGAYAPFMQILSQPWSSIYGKSWALSLGRPTNWDGDWADWYSHWQSMRNYALPPFDNPTPVAMGTGPFMFEEWNNSLQQWSLVRNHNYWRGWPLDWPVFGSSRPVGYIERYVVSWASDWNARSTMFLNGDVDICAVPRQYFGQMLNQPGIRSTYPLPSLGVDALLYDFNINAASPYGPILPSGTFEESGVPSDFFGNASWGVHVRKAFSWAIEYDALISEKYSGEASHPPTAILPVLPHYCPSVSGYHFDLGKAAEELRQVPRLWDTGFTIQLLFPASSSPTQKPYEQMSQAINSLNPKFHCRILQLYWSEYLSASQNKQRPVFTAGWLADYPDPHDFAYAFYYSRGNFASRQGYNSSAMDALIELAIGQPGYQEREATYASIQQLAIDDCPSTTLATALVRHFERTWVCGWCYNPMYPGVYAGNLWKWYYTPHAQLDTVTGATGNLLPYDVNYDGKTNMVDIGMAAASFGAVYGPPISSRWIYRCDFNNDRKIDMRDIGRVASSFGKTSTPWTPP
jgi:peptide/nickel transport system substrate-binding protein